MMPTSRALVHQGDGRPSPAPPPSLANWASERRWLRGDGFEASPIVREMTPTLSLVSVSHHGGAPQVPLPVFSLLFTGGRCFRTPSPPRMAPGMARWPEMLKIPGDAHVFGDDHLQANAQNCSISVGCSMRRHDVIAWRGTPSPFEFPP